MQHSALGGTLLAVQLSALVVAALWWWRSYALEWLVVVLHRISGLLCLSAAILGWVADAPRPSAPLHVVYVVVWGVVWVYQWRLLAATAPRGRVAQYWAVSLVIACVVVRRIAESGAAS
ncbi:MAG: hypothetical protein RLZZ297_1295 [Chloroflexota bacterium]